MRFPRLAAIALLAPLLGGCFTVDQTLNVGSETDAELVVRAAIPTSMVAMVESYSGASGQKFCSAPANSEKLGFQTTVERVVEGENTACVATARGTLAAIAKTAADRSYLPKDLPAQQANALRYSLEKLSPGTWKLSVTLTPPPEFRMLTGGDDMMRATQMAVFGDLTGKGLSWSIAANEIVESTGAVSPDRKTATYTLALADLLAKPQASYTFVTTFRTTP